MNCYIASLQPCKSFNSFSSHFPSNRDFRNEISLTLFGNNIPGRVSLVDYRKSPGYCKIRASFEVDEGSQKPLIEPGMLSSCGAVRFNPERSNQGKALFATFFRGWICGVLGNLGVTFYNYSSTKVNLVLLAPGQLIEISGNLWIRNLEAGHQLRVPHSDVLNYCKTARKFNIQASIKANTRSVKLLIPSFLLFQCGAICFSFEHTNKGKCFRATYYYSDSRKKVTYAEEPVEDF